MKNSISDSLNYKRIVSALPAFAAFMLIFIFAAVTFLVAWFGQTPL